MAKTEISWSQYTWNVVAGCLRVSPGCGGGIKGPDGGQGGCYAETMAVRIVRMGGYEWIDGEWRDDPKKKHAPGARRAADKYKPLVRINKAGEARWTGVFAFDEEKLTEPLRRKTPTMYFVNSMSDLFGEGLTNEQIAAVFGVMAACPQHTFQCLTKRADRMVEWFEWMAMRGQWERMHRALVAQYVALDWPAFENLDPTWPLPGVWIGVSCERQEEADARIPLLLKCPAAVRWVSAEPLLGSVDLSNYMDRGYESGGPRGWIDLPSVDWVVGGGESGYGARSCDVEWLRSLARQCKYAGVPYFNKQLGAFPTWNGCSSPGEHWSIEAMQRMVDINFETGLGFRVHLNDKKGADPAEWPEDLQVREYPRGFTLPKKSEGKKHLPMAEDA